MKRDEILNELSSIKLRLEEVITVCLEDAPDDFYSEDEAGNRVIIISKVKPLAKMASEALHSLYELSAKI